MRYDEALIDEAVLAVLYLTAWEEHGLTRAWRGIDWEATNRLHELGLIDDPKSKSKSVIFTEAGQDSFPRGRVNDHVGLLSNPRLERAVRRGWLRR